MPELISPLELSSDEPAGAGDEGRGVPVTELDLVRELILQAHPDVVPELVSGGTVEALLASVDPAREAYSRLHDAWSEREPASQHAPAQKPVQVPAGGGAPIMVDVDRMPAAEKIRRGLALAGRTQKG